VITPVVSGVSVGELFQANLNAFDESSLILIFHQICQGIKFYHEFGIAYDRVHPNNIIIDGNGKVILHIIESESKYFTNISILDIKSDIFQLGCLFNDMCPPNPSKELQSFLRYDLCGPSFLPSIHSILNHHFFISKKDLINNRNRAKSSFFSFSSNKSNSNPDNK
jgi:serine/threonine protein kinase